jgi:hypothetical protein
VIRIIWLLGVVPLLGLPKAVSTVSVSDSSSFFARGELRGAEAATGVDTTPQLDLSTSWRYLTLSGSYAPRLVVANVSGPEDAHLRVLHTGSLALSWRTERSQLELGQYFGVGEQYLGTLPQLVTRDPLAPLDPSTSRAPLLATVDSLRVRQTTTSVRGTHQWTERLTSGVDASYAVSGGADAQARALSPRFETALVGSTLGYALSEQAQLQGRLSTSHIDSSTRNVYWISDAIASWTMSWSERLASTVGAGASWIQRSRGEHASSASAAPNLTASLVETIEHRGLTLKLRSGGRLAPFVNTLTAELQTTLQGSLGANLRIAETELDLSLDGSRSLPLDASDHFRVLGVGSRATQGIRDWLGVYAQVRVLEQRVAQVAASLPAQWMVIAGVVVSAPKLDL